MFSHPIKVKEKKLGFSKTKSVILFRRISRNFTPKSRELLKKVTRIRGKPNTLERWTKLTIIQPWRIITIVELATPIMRQNMSTKWLRNLRSKKPWCWRNCRTLIAKKKWSWINWTSSTLCHQLLPKIKWIRVTYLNTDPLKAMI